MKRIYRFDTETLYSNTIVNLPSVSFTDDSTSDFYDDIIPCVKQVLDNGLEIVTQYPNGICDYLGDYQGSSHSVVKLYFKRIRKNLFGIYSSEAREIYIDKYLQLLGDDEATSYCIGDNLLILYVSQDNPYFKSPPESNCIVDSNGVLRGGSNNAVIPEFVNRIGSSSLFNLKFDHFIIPNSVTTIDEEALSCYADEVTIGSGLTTVNDTVWSLIMPPKTEGVSTRVNIDTMRHFCNITFSGYFGRGDRTYYLNITREIPASSGNYIILGDSNSTPIVDQRFAGNLNLTHLLLIGDIFTRAFLDCANLVELDLSLTTTLSSYCFAGCTSLETIIVKSNDITSLTNINGSAFSGCTSLTNVNFSEAVNLVEIGRGNPLGPFYNCTSLIEVKLPSSITYIGPRFVNGCTSLLKVIINATTPPTISTYTWTGSNNCLIYVPDASVNTYKAALYWSAIADRIKPISELT